MTTTEPTIQLRGLSVGEHVLNVSAVDAAGNVDPFPRQLKFSTATTALKESALLAVALVPSNTTDGGVFNFSGWSKDHFEWRLDAGSWTEARGTPLLEVSASPGRPHYLEARPAGLGGLSTAPPLLVAWSVLEGASTLRLQGLQDGHHKLTVKAVDAVGNEDRGSKSWSWVVDTSPPQGCRLVPATLPSRHPCLNDSIVPTDSCALNVTGVNEPIWKVVSSLDAGGAVEWAGGGSTAGGGIAVAPAGVAVGRHTLHIWVEDAAGNRSPQPCAVWSWTYDPYEPRVWLLNTDQLRNLTASSTSTFHVQSNRTDVSVQWSLAPSGPWQSFCDRKRGAANPVAASRRQVWQRRACGVCLDVGGGPVSPTVHNARGWQSLGSVGRQLNPPLHLSSRGQCGP